MKRVVRSRFSGLIFTGTIASGALLIESGLPVSQDTHFLLQLLWLGIIGAALLAFAIQPALNLPAPMDDEHHRIDTDIPELFDRDRAWLQSHPDSSTRKWE